MTTYEGFAHAALKHTVLREYLTKWGHKLASVGRTRRVTLWYVDCFAGPWHGADEATSSAAIGLRRLQEAARTWRAKGADIQLKAVFIEEDAARFAELEAFVASIRDDVDAECLQGDFEKHVAYLQRVVGRDDPALFFVDPFGWKGASIDVLRPLTQGPRHEILVNVMTPFVQRFIGADVDPEIAAGLRRFLALPPETQFEKISEADVARLYRQRLKDVCGFTFALDVMIPDVDVAKLKYRLVLGTRSDAAVKVLRDVEASMSKKAGELRAETRDRAVAARTGQGSLFGAEASPDRYIEDLRQLDLVTARELLPRLAGAGLPWKAIWPHLLEELHVREMEASQVAGMLHKEGRLVIEGFKKGQHVSDEQVVRAVGHG